MTEAEKQAIEKLHNGKKMDLISIIRTFKREGIENFVVTKKETVDTVLNLIEKQQAEIRQYEKALQDQIIKGCEIEKGLKEEIEKLRNNNKDLLRKLRNRVKEVKKLTRYSLYKKEFSTLNKQLEKKDKIIDEMVEKLSYVEDLKLDVCVNCKEDCRIPRNQGDCIKTDCIKEYFKKKVQKT